MILQRIQNGINSLLLIIQNSFPRRQQAIIIIIAILLCVAAAASGLVYSSSFTPIIVGLGLGGVLLLAVGLSRPWFAFYAAIFIIFIPTDFISADIQSYLNRGMTVFVFAVWAFDLFVNKKKVILPIPSMIMVIFLAWAIISMTWAQNFSQSLTIIQQFFLRFLLFLFLFINLIDSRKKLNGLLNTLAIIGYFLVLVGLGQLAVEGYSPGTRFQILGMNENGTGILLLVCMLGVLWWASQPSIRYGTIKKLIGIFYIFSSIGLVAMSGSRGSAISFAVTLCLLVIWKSTRFWGTLAIFMVLIGLVAAPFLFLTTIERFTSSAGYSGDTTLGGREALWQLAWLLIRDNPVKGVGIGNGYLRMKDYLSDSSIDSYLMPLQIWHGESISPHSPILAIWSDVGVIGLALYMGILGTAIYSFLRSFWRNRHTNFQLYYYLLTAIFVGYILSWVKGGGMESDHSFFMMIGFLIIPSILEKQHELDDSTKTAAS